MTIFTYAATRSGERLTDVAITASDYETAMVAARAKAYSWYGDGVTLVLLRTSTY